VSNGGVSAGGEQVVTLVPDKPTLAPFAGVLFGFDNWRDNCDSSGFGGSGFGGCDFSSDFSDCDFRRQLGDISNDDGGSDGN